MNQEKLVENILIVDDTIPNLRVLSTMLKAENYKVRKATDGESAIEAVKENQPDLILLDIKMPGMDGYEVCKFLKSDVKTKDIPIIFISAMSDIDDKVKAFEFGGSDYIIKPFQEQEVLARVKSQLTIEKQKRLLEIAKEKAEIARAYIRKTFGRYVTNEIVDKILESPEGLKLGGQRREVTILVSDLRGFTAKSEQLEPEEVVKILNFYLSAMADIITKYQGVIDEFMGDGILVLFGAIIDRKDQAEIAIACALEMQLEMDKVNQQMKKWGQYPLEMGIGINTGEVVVGNIGSEKRTKYGVVGSQVNLTYRIESYTIGGQILISESTWKKTVSILEIAQQHQVKPKGVKQPITIYQVQGICGKYNLFLPEQIETFVCLSEPLKLQYELLQDKHLDDKILEGKIIAISEKSAVITLENMATIPCPFTNLKLNLFMNNQGVISEDVYAKVINKPQKHDNLIADNQDFFYVSFTAKPPQVEKLLLQKLLENNK